MSVISDPAALMELARVIPDDLASMNFIGLMVGGRPRWRMTFFSWNLWVSRSSALSDCWSIVPLLWSTTMATLLFDPSVHKSAFYGYDVLLFLLPLCSAGVFEEQEVVSACFGYGHLLRQKRDFLLCVV